MADQTIVDCAQEEPAMPVCPGCAEVNTPVDHFCKKCGMPISAESSIMPFERIYAEGWLWRKVVSGPVRPMVLLGTWLVFGPVFVGGLFLFYPLLSLIPETGRHIRAYEWGLTFGNVIMFLFIIVSPLISGLILWKVTRNYYRFRRAHGAGGERPGQNPPQRPAAESEEQEGIGWNDD